MTKSEFAGRVHNTTQPLATGDTHLNSLLALPLRQPVHLKFARDAFVQAVEMERQLLSSAVSKAADAQWRPGELISSVQIILSGLCLQRVQALVLT